LYNKKSSILACLQKVYAREQGKSVVVLRTVLDYRDQGLLLYKEKPKKGHAVPIRQRTICAYNR
jgi:hypothetical protein